MTASMSSQPGYSGEERAQIRARFYAAERRIRRADVLRYAGRVAGREAGHTVTSAIAELIMDWLDAAQDHDDAAQRQAALRQADSSLWREEGTDAERTAAFMSAAEAYRAFLAGGAG